MRENPIVIVEDDVEDCEMLTGALKSIGIQNEFRCFDTPVGALQYLRSTDEKTFLIISDVNMPLMNGLQFKDTINSDDFLNDKRIPFVFLSTSATTYLVQEAFRLCVQGYFQKPNSMDGLKKVAHSIINYWQTSMLPVS